MPLIAFWQSDPASVLSMSIEQIISSAGDGKLRDNSECSVEFRAFLNEVPVAALRGYAEHCLTTSFQKSGQVLQDVVNELGRRLDFTVTNGRYQGTTNDIGNDGLWVDGNGHALIIEVKTTDTYRISLDTIAGYRDAHVAKNDVGSSNSMLIVVGREDTGELEAQVRGSRHAWDTRLISVESLLRLVDLKEDTEENATAEKIRSLLRPEEFTRLDRLIDVLFSAAKDVEETPVDPPGKPDSPTSGWEFTAPELIGAKRDAIIAAVGKSLGRTLVKKTRATYWDSEKRIRAVCTISKRYEKEGAVAYWYAYHPGWDEFLTAGERGVFILGGMDINSYFVIPHTFLRAHLSKLNTTQKADGTSYWHIKILEPQPGEFLLQLPKGSNHLPLRDYQKSLNPTAI